MKTTIVHFLIFYFFVIGNCYAKDTLSDWTKDSDDPTKWGEKYFEKNFKDPRFETKASNGMFKILKKVSERLNGINNVTRRPCKEAAYQAASSILYDFKAIEITEGFGNILIDIEKNIFTLGTKSLKDFIEEKLKEQIKNLEEQIKKKVKNYLRNKPPEYYQRKATPTKIIDGKTIKEADAVVKAIWVKKTGKYEVYISGNSHCVGFQIGGLASGTTKPKQTVKIKKWRVKIYGDIDVVLSRNKDHFIFHLVSSKIEILADCNCVKLPKPPKKVFVIPD